MIELHFSEAFLTEEEKREMQEIVDGYERLDTDLFIKRVGGIERVEEMKKINNALDTLEVSNGVVTKKKKPLNESGGDLEEWKKGFMEGFEEAYKRFNAVKS